MVDTSDLWLWTKRGLAFGVITTIVGLIEGALVLGGLLAGVTDFSIAPMALLNSVAEVETAATGIYLALLLINIPIYGAVMSYVCDKVK